MSTDAPGHLLLAACVWLPIVLALGFALAGPMPRWGMRLFAGLGFVLPAIGAIVLFVIYLGLDRAGGWAFGSEIPTGLDILGIRLRLGLNGIGAPLFLMTSLVGAAAGLHAIRQEVDRPQTYLALLLLMYGGILGVYASVNVFFFYLFHEIALIPTFILINLWGGARRRTAAMQMTIYLTAGALISLLGLLALYFQSGAFATGRSFDIPVLQNVLRNATLAHEPTIFALLLFGFGILVSLFPFHTWAPQGYANAPTPAAMLHAGALKKFGLYGLIQLAAPLLLTGAAYWQEVLVWLALGNLLLIGLVTLAQRHLHMLIGYSSVMHMGYAFLGIATYNALGVNAALLVMVAHGLSVALLFLLGDHIRARCGTYDMNAMGGLVKVAPVLSGFFAAAMLASIGLPGFANFWGEFAVFLALWQYDPAVTALAALAIIISALYGLRAVSRIFFGEHSPLLKAFLTQAPAKDLTLRERLPAALLLVALLTFGFWPRGVGDLTDPAVSELRFPGAFEERLSADAEPPAEPLAATEKAPQ